MRVEAFTYGQIRNSIKTGDILLCSGDGFVSDAIKLFTKDKTVKINGEKISFTHCGVLDNWYSRVMIIEAVDGREVQHNSLSNSYIKPNYDGRLFLARLTKKAFKDHDINIWSVIDRLSSTINYDYSEMDIAKIALNKLGFNYKPENDNKFYCSELVNYGYSYIFKDSKKFSVPTDIGMSNLIKIYAEIK